MLWPKKNSYKEFHNEQKFLRLEIPPPPPITFLVVRPLLPRKASSLVVWSSLVGLRERLKRRRKREAHHLSYCCGV